MGHHHAVESSGRKRPGPRLDVRNANLDPADSPERNERYGRPSNPAFLLRPDELLHSLEPLAVVAFEQGLVSEPKQAVIQRVCAVREGGGSVPLDAPAA